MGTITITQSSPNAERIYLYPNADLSGCTDWDGITSPNYTNVDEDRNDLDVTDYVYTNSTSFVTDLYEIQTPSVSSGTITYVKVHQVVQSDISPSSNVEYYITISPESKCTEIYVSDNQDLVTAWRKLTYSWDFNPKRAEDVPIGVYPAWIWADFNTLCIGMRAKSDNANPTLQTTLRPNGVGGFSQLTPVGEFNNYECVDEAVKDDDTTYVKTPNNSGTFFDAYDIETDAALTGSTIISVSVFAWMRCSAGNGWGRVVVRTGVGQNYNGTEYSFSEDSSYSLISHEWETNPNTGLPWTKADIDSLEVGIRLRNNASNRVMRCTQVYTVVNYKVGAAAELRNAQTYVEVGYTPSSTTCTLQSPQELIHDHNRIIKMFNFWNGDREVYDLSRSNKTLAITGMESQYSTCTNPCDRIQCIRRIGKNGAVVTVAGLNPTCYNGDYRIKRFAYEKITEKPETYKWVMELESAVL